ncbi:MAG TPA: hypothetical protein V6C65_00280 [Allocoleopsis sp.]
MKLFAIALLAFSLATPSFAADETMTVTGSRTPEGPTPPAFGGGGAPGRPAAQKPKRFGEGEEGGGSFTPKKKVEITNAEILVMVMEQWGQMVDLAASKEVWGELDIIVTTKEGTKVEVHLKVGFGTKEVVSAKKK